MEVLNFMAEDKKVDARRVKSLVKGELHKELHYVIHFKKFPIQEVEKIVGEFGSVNTIKFFIEHKKEKKFTILQECIENRANFGNDELLARIAVLPYATKEFKDKTEEMVMAQDDFIIKYNYLIKSGDKKHLKEIEDIVYANKDVAMMQGICAFVPGADIKRFEDFMVNECEDNEEKTRFLFLVPNCNKERLAKSIVSDYYLRHFLSVYKTSDNKYPTIYQTLVKLQRPELVDIFFESHAGNRVAELAKHATTKKEQNFVLSMLNRAPAQLEA